MRYGDEALWGEGCFEDLVEGGDLSLCELVGEEMYVLRYVDLDEVEVLGCW